MMTKISYGWHKGLTAIGVCLIVAGVYASTEARHLLSERIRLSGAIRFQWSDMEGRQPRDGFETRLARLTASFQLNEQFLGRIMVEFASGERAASAELQDAYIVWRPNARLSVSAGQQLMPIFYDGRERITVLDVLERAEVVGVYLQGARGRGVFASYEIEPGYHIQVGLWNSLTFQDPQLVGRGGQAEVMGALNVHATLNAYQLRLGGFAGRRPGFTTTSESNTPLNVPDTERWLWY
ncbi:MAG: porin, partial [Fimbriimonadales bacterium]